VAGSKKSEWYTGSLHLCGQNQYMVESTKLNSYLPYFNKNILVFGQNMAYEEVLMVAQKLRDYNNLFKMFCLSYSFISVYAVCKIMFCNSNMVHQFSQKNVVV